MALTQERLRELLDYDPETGVFRNKVARSNVPAGSVAGSLTQSGYVRISVDDVSYRAHRLAWLWMTGEWPRAFVDHRDTDKANNRWSNLREASKSQNGANRPVQANSRSKLKGAHFTKANGKWMSLIQHHGRKLYLGYFPTAEEAHAAYAAAAKNIYGEFARAV